MFTLLIIYVSIAIPMTIISLFMWGKMFTEKISQEKVDEVRTALEIVTGYKTDLSNLELKAIIYYGNKLVEKGVNKWLEV
jgi:hypothetical protein